MSDRAPEHAALGARPASAACGGDQPLAIIMVTGVKAMTTAVEAEFDYEADFNPMRL